MFSLMVCLLLQSAQTPPVGVRAELLARNLPPPKDADDLDKPITSYSVLDDRQGFVIAYYALYARHDDRVHDLRVRSFDKRSRTWRSATFPESIGSVLRIMRGRGYLFVSGHSSPSAAPTLVLSGTLRKKRELDGWPVLVVDDGRLVFHRSMVHFSPTHAGALALYDPASDDSEVSLYPPPEVANERGGERVPGTDLWIDRSITDVKNGKVGTIEFVALEQRMRLDRRQGASPAGPKQRLHVVCNVAAARPVCSVRPTPPSSSAR